jgi:hypothetical protein
MRKGWPSHPKKTGSARPIPGTRKRRESANSYRPRVSLLVGATDRLGIHMTHERGGRQLAYRLRGFKRHRPAPRECDDGNQ